MTRPIGRRIRTAREEKGISQKELGEKIGRSSFTISSWECGKTRPREEDINKLGKVLGQFSGTGKRSSKKPVRPMPMPPVPKISKSRKIVRRGNRKGNIETIEDSDSPMGKNFLGEWVEQQMAKENLTPFALHKKSGVSYQTIRNLLSGKILNPQESTRKKLESALQKDVPHEISEAAEKEQQVGEIGSLIDFNPHDNEDLPAVAGVYVLYDISERPMYVGKSSQIAARIRTHRDKFWFKAPIVENAAYVAIHDVKLRDQVEQVLIKFLKSNAVINKQGVSRGED